ncbi:MAG: WxL domain-containing protein, partial [Vagococcus sp.]|uniref:WxL domain-containing protein n=2 Tax=Vagococcus sp. TaxID=1933889 RepID=UPI002FC617BA
MKANKILGTVLLSGLVLSLATPAFAATAEEIQKDLNKSNDMQVKISAAKEIDPEVDPTKPVVDPPEVIHGSIGISQVSPLFFKEVKLNGKQQMTAAQFYSRAQAENGERLGKASEFTGKIEKEYADEDAFPKEAITPSMQVVDARGTREGWTITAKLTELKADEEVMKGATLTYSNPIVTS